MKIQHMIIILLAVICNQDAIAGRVEEVEEINKHDVHNSSVSHYTQVKTKHVKVNLSEIHSSTIGIHLPQSVEDVDMTLSDIHSSAIILYSRHTPKINQQQNRELHNSSVKLCIQFGNIRII